MIKIAAPQIGPEEIESVQEVLESGLLADGIYVRRFEEAFACYQGANYGVATSSGTTALHAALLAAGIGPGDQVITTPFTFIATANAIMFCGAEPVFADIDPATGNLSIDSVKEVLQQNKRARAILVVHLYGLPANPLAWQQLAQEQDLLLIEDCAQAHGAAFNQKKVGTFGLVSAFSFYATKNMATGEGGMVLTNDKGTADLTRMIVNHGSRIKYQHEFLGYNYRLTNVAAAIGLAQLDKLERFTEQRRQNAAFLNQGLQGLPWLTIPVEPSGYRHVYHQYAVQLPNRQERDGLAQYLKERGVETAMHYPIPLHQQPFFQQLGYSTLELPAAVSLADRVLSLPVHPGLTEEDLQTIVTAIREYGGQ